MPHAPARICQCGRRVLNGERCPCRVVAHRESRAAYDKTRPNAAARGYDSDWQDLRTRYLREHPFCSHEGCNAQATEVDHIKPVSIHPQLRLDPLNLRSFCKPHHSSRTQREHRRDRGLVKDFGPKGR
jgi:5-methylcytosine-specific restriction enzyme A